MATKFKIKKVNPNVPVYTGYVACPSTCDQAYILPTDCPVTEPGDCPDPLENGFYSSCNECCPDPLELGFYLTCDECCPDPIDLGYYLNCDECCPECPSGSQNYSIIDYVDPAISGDQPDFEGKNWGIEGTSFYNQYVKPFERNFGLVGQSMKMYWVAGEIDPAGSSMSADVLSASPEFGGPRVQFSVPYVNYNTDTFSAASLSSGFGNEFRAYDFTGSGPYTLIYHYSDQDKFIILNNFFQLN